VVSIWLALSFGVIVLVTLRANHYTSLFVIPTTLHKGCHSA